MNQEFEESNLNKQLAINFIQRFSLLQFKLTTVIKVHRVCDCKVPFCNYRCIMCGMKLYTSGHNISKQPITVDYIGLEILDCQGKDMNYCGTYGFKYIKIDNKFLEKYDHFPVHLLNHEKRVLKLICGDKTNIPIHPTNHEPKRTYSLHCAYVEILSGEQMRVNDLPAKFLYYMRYRTTIEYYICFSSTYFLETIRLIKGLRRSQKSLFNRMPKEMISMIQLYIPKF